MNKYLDANGLLYVWEKVKGQLGGKVDKVSGKGLSANDYTDEEKAKLAGLEIASDSEVAEMLSEVFGAAG